MLVNAASNITLVTPGDYVMSFIATGTGVLGSAISLSDGIQNLSLASTINAGGTQVQLQALFTATKANSSLTPAITATTCSGGFAVVARVPLGSTS